MKVSTLKHLIAGGAIVGIIAVAVLVPTKNDVKAARVLESQGYTAVEITGLGFFGCDRWHAHKAAFSATTSSGARVSGVVCRDLFSRSVVRVFE